MNITETIIKTLELSQDISTARDLFNKYGEKLIGREVLTIPYGEWPGGLATVIKIKSDPGAPEIVFQVKSKKHGEIGIFDHEPLTLLPKGVKE